MITAYDVPPSKLINKLAEKIRELKDLEPPDWASFVKTGIHRERIPENNDWWYYRAASILYQVYIRGPIGTGFLRKKYGGRSKNKPRPEHKVFAGGKIIRTILQQLEAAGLVVKTVKGRKISPRGQSFLDKLAQEIIKEIQKSKGE
ncbi:MAG: 30S ribosomal protein S19e [Candidatus Baldrarchaeia archaeon]